MIRSFGNKDTERLFNRKNIRKLPVDIQRHAKMKLNLIDAASSLNDLSVLPGDRMGQWSIRINRQWSICFEWHKGDAFNVEIVDYH